MYLYLNVFISLCIYIFMSSKLESKLVDKSKTMNSKNIRKIYSAEPSES